MSEILSVSFRPPYLRAAEELRNNRGQWQAYESIGNCVVLAGPGSGKTKTLTVKVARLLAEDVAAPRGIACITYNAECSRELRSKLEDLGVQESRRVFVGTIHAFCLKYVVGPYGRLCGLNLAENIRVASPGKQDLLFERALFQEIDGNEYPSYWRTRCDLYRRTHLDRLDSSWGEDEQAARVIERYEEFLRNSGLVDFDDMVLLGLQVIRNNGWVRRAIRARFPILVIDEYQDLGSSLHLMVLEFLKEGIRILAVGDADQSIYGFAGARPELLEELAGLPTVERIVLPFNYRSGRTIVEASKTVLGEPRSYKAVGVAPGTIDFHERVDGLEAQAEHICDSIIPEVLGRRPGRTPKDIAVLYVDKNDGDVIAEKVAEAGMKAIRIDRGAPYQKTPLTRWLEDCAAWCSGGWKKGTPRLSALIRTWGGFHGIWGIWDEKRLQALAKNLVRFLYTHRLPALTLQRWLADFTEACMPKGRSVGRYELLDLAESLEELLNTCRAGGKLEGLTVAEFSGQTGAADHINLVTLHSSKGLEFDVVIMIGLEQGRMPNWQAKTTESKREPRRLFYVGLTRARHEVHMTYSGWYENRHGRFEMGESEFLIEVRRRLREMEE